MKNVLIAVMAVVIVVLAGALGFLIDDPQTSTLEIDRDRAAVAAEIEAVKQETTKYSGGLVVSFIELRLSILRITEAMLDQKRSSALRRVRLTYAANQEPTKPAPDTALNDILEEINQAQNRAEASRQEAAKYSGGLVQGLALVRVQTDELAVSELRLKFYSAKHGFPILPAVSKDKKGVAGSPPLSEKIVSDKEAL